MIKKGDEWVINNEWCKHCGSVKKDKIYLIRRKNLYDCYGRPSRAKQEIYDYWCRWFENEGGWCSVRSYNSNVFTLCGCIDDPDLGRCYVEIYPTHNDVYVIE